MLLLSSEWWLPNLNLVQIFEDIFEVTLFKVKVYKYSIFWKLNYSKAGKNFTLSLFSIKFDDDEEKE